MKPPKYGDEGVVGRVYLVHFARPIGGPGSKGASHYTGWARNVHRRMQEHRRGEGAKILAHASRVGVEYHVVAVSPGTRAHERRLKTNGHARRRCPVCNPDEATEENMQPYSTIHKTPGNVGIVSRTVYTFACGACNTTTDLVAPLLALARKDARAAGWRNGYRRDFAFVGAAAGIDSTWRCPECVAGRETA